MLFYAACDAQDTNEHQQHVIRLLSSVSGSRSDCSGYYFVLVIREQPVQPVLHGHVTCTESALL